MDEKLKILEENIKKIQERNVRVETDKAWETSWFRILSLTLLTYVVATLVLYFIGSANYFLNALIPTVGFFLSIQSLPILKNIWVKKFIDKSVHRQGR